jgi:hypothetical protein
VTQSSPGGGRENPNAGGRGNIAAIIAVVVLAALGYWAFTSIDHQRKLQNCLDSGRHNCEDYLNTNK